MKARPLRALALFGPLQTGAAMEAILKAIEVEGAVDAEHQLHLDTPLPIAGPSRVRVIILFPEQADSGDIAEEAWLHGLARNPVFDFLSAPEEDIYTLADGEPFHDQG